MFAQGTICPQILLNIIFLKEILKHVFCAICFCTVFAQYENYQNGFAYYCFTVILPSVLCSVYSIKSTKVSGSIQFLYYDAQGSEMMMMMMMMTMTAEGGRLKRVTMQVFQIY